MVTKIMNIK